MRVGELRQLLDKYHEDLEIIKDEHSDYAHVNDVAVIKAVDQGGYLMRSHPTMSKDNFSREKEYLYIR